MSSRLRTSLVAVLLSVGCGAQSGAIPAASEGSTQPGGAATDATAAMRSQAGGAGRSSTAATTATPAVTGAAAAGARAVTGPGAGKAGSSAPAAGQVGPATSPAAGTAGTASATLSGAGAVAGAGAQVTAAGAAAVSGDGSARALTDLDAYLAMPRASRPALASQSFATVALSKADAKLAEQKLWADFAAGIKESRKEEVGATETTERTIRVPGNDKVLRYNMVRRGKAPATGWSLFISMHGGGNTTAAMNDSQWRNQVELASGYDPKDALWVAPRAPIDDWNMWFIKEIDELLERLITDLIVFENVDPNKVYINGYSAGGDGVYQLGPRMAERWAGAGMSAGHPNASSPLSLRNLAFAIHVGGNDTSFDRNKKGEEWGKRLEMLAAEDPGGYVNQWQVHAGKPHWMDLEDAVSIPFLQSHTRNPYPTKIVWEQAEYPRAHFYWLAADESNRSKGALIRAHFDANGVHITAAQGVKRISVLLSDAMFDLDAPVHIDFMGKSLAESPVRRTIGVIQRTLEERGEPAMLFSAEVTVDLQ